MYANYQRPQSALTARTGSARPMAAARVPIRPFSARAAQEAGRGEPSLAELNAVASGRVLPVEMDEGRLFSTQPLPEMILPQATGSPRTTTMHVPRSEALLGAAHAPNNSRLHSAQRGRLLRWQAKSRASNIGASSEWVGNGAPRWKSGRPPPRVRTVADAEDLKLSIGPNTRAAIDRFDVLHHRLSTGTLAINRALENDVTSLSKQQGFRHGLNEVFSQRLVVHEALAGVTRYAGKKKKIVQRAKDEWHLATSIWGPRARTCDSKDVWNTRACAQSLHVLNWRRALNHGLAKLIMKADDGGSDDGEGGDGDEVDEVSDVLWDHYDLMHTLFDYHASLGSSDNIFEIHLNGFTEFAEKFELVDASSKHLNKSAWDGMFIALDAAPAASDDGDLAEPFGSKKALSRSDFSQVIVRAAIAKYVLPKEVVDVSRAVQKLIEDEIRPRADPRMFSPANQFRELIYVEEVCVVLRRHEASLRLIYEELCALKPKTLEHNGLANRLISYPNFLDGLRLFNLVNVDLAERIGTASFVASRMKTINDQLPKSRIKMMHLNFLDFLEALCRLSTIKALPTDKEIQEAGYEDACTYLLQLANEEQDEYQELLKTREGTWGVPPTLQPIDRCVEFMCHLLIVQCQGGLERKEGSDLVLTEKLAKWGIALGNAGEAGKLLLA